ncbi:hypothetical protein ACFXPC_10210 [Streptomyces cyaneofuscatus]
MRRIADLCPGDAKTDARDARDARDALIIADAVRAMHHTLPSAGLEDGTITEPGMIACSDDDPTGEPPGSRTGSTACRPRSSAARTGPGPAAPAHDRPGPA